MLKTVTFESHNSEST